MITRRSLLGSAGRLAAVAPFVGLAAKATTSEPVQEALPKLEYFTGELMEFTPPPQVVMNIVQPANWTVAETQTIADQIGRIVSGYQSGRFIP